jgi:hypothetical protein
MPGAGEAAAVPGSLALWWLAQAMGFLYHGERNCRIAGNLDEERM